ncbi:MAG: hypothetical protein ABR559_08005 [Gemmatimonadota bacterium]
MRPADRHLLLSLALAAALSGAGAAPLRAQSSQVPALGDSVTVIAPAPGLVTFGVASYDGGGQRDPFVPLTAASPAQVGPQLRGMRLTGVFVGAGGNSLAVLEDATKRGHFVRVGQQVGTARLIEIRPDAAVFEIREYGAVRREVLRLERTVETPKP